MKWFWGVLTVLTVAAVFNFLCICLYIALTTFIVFVKFVIIPADGDLVLLFCEKFGASPSKSLEKKTVWITGASSGIGEALALALAKVGAKLVLSARRTENLNEVKQKCIEAGASGEDVFILPMDMLKLENHQEMCNEVIKKFGSIDILISNAGRTQRAHWETIDVAVDRELFELNVFSLVNLARIVTTHFMKLEKGHHVVTSSTAGRIGFPFSATYTASKHALHGYFECLRTEKAGKGIDITLLCPGPVESNLMDSCFSSNLNEKCTQKRLGNLMTAARCAELSLVAIANKLPEVWIAHQPVIFMHHCIQYIPFIVARLINIFGVDIIMKARDGQSSLSTKS